MAVMRETFLLILLATWVFTLGGIRDPFYRQAYFSTHLIGYHKIIVANTGNRTRNFLLATKNNNP